MTRYLNSFFIALTLYSSVFAFIIYQSTIDNFSNKKNTNENVSRVCFSIINEEIPAKEEKPKEEPKIEKKVEKKKIEKKIVKKEVLQIPQPILEAAREPIKKEIPEPVPTEEVEKVAENETKTLANPNQNVQKVINTSIEKTVDTNLLKAKQDEFLAYLIEKINSNKSYPNIARRRVIEGNVEVKFHLCSDGNVANIKMISGKKIFHKSAVEAISRSFPIEVNKTLFNFPKEFKITMAYVLK